MKFVSHNWDLFHVCMPKQRYWKAELKWIPIKEDMVSGSKLDRKSVLILRTKLKTRSQSALQWLWDVAN